LGQHSTRFLWKGKKVRTGVSAEEQTPEVERRDVFRPGKETGGEKPRLVEVSVVATFAPRVG